MFNKKKLKQLVDKIPPEIGMILSHVDYRFRIGRSYSNYKRDAGSIANREHIFENMVFLVKFAFENIPFYRDFYTAHGFHYSSLQRFDDLIKIPVIKKADLQKFPLSSRTVHSNGRIKSNTGGTTGQPLDFYLDGDAYAREWGHMHFIWERLGYQTSDLKLTIRGNNLGSQALKYCFNQNEFQINAYSPIEDVFESLAVLTKKYSFKYIHGYPSAVFDFVKRCQNGRPDLIDALRHTVRGIFFSSEYPAPHYRNEIAKILDVPNMSWYGHSEMAVLAYEKNAPFEYFALQNYGYAEAVSMNDGVHLVGTTIHNFVCPLIRYDTGDLINPINFNDGILESFTISEGRVGEFVVDKFGRNISLTALIFGRHHEVFGVAKFVQIHQPEAGKINVVVVADNFIRDVENLFDFSNVSMDVLFHFRDSPIKSRSGKVSLLLKEFYETSNSNP